jgi:hypothetical protein
VGTSLLLNCQLGRLNRQTMAEARALFAAAQVVFWTLIDQAEMGYPLSGIRWLGHDVAFAEAVGAKSASARATTSTAAAGTREPRSMDSHLIEISSELEELWSMRTSDEYVLERGGCRERVSRVAQAWPPQEPPRPRPAVHREVPASSSTALTRCMPHNRFASVDELQRTSPSAATDSSRWSDRADSAPCLGRFGTLASLGSALGCPLPRLAVARFLEENRRTMFANHWRLTCRST